MPDFSFLLGAKPIETPNPLDLAGKGMTLADLMQRVQTGQLALQKQQNLAAAFSDPAVLAAFSQSTAPGQPGATGGAGGALDLTPFAKYGVAAPDLVGQFLKTQKEFADIGKTRADTAEAQRKVLDAQLTNLSNYASAAAANPTPGTLMGFARQYQMTGLPVDAFGKMPDDPTDIAGWQDYLKQAGSILTSPEQRQNIIKSQTMLPLEAGQARATTAKTEAETAQMPAKLAVEQSQARSSAIQAAAHSADVFGPKVETSETTGYPVSVSRFGPNGPSVTPLGGPGAADQTAAPQMKLNPSQASVIKAQGPVLDEASKNIASAQRILQLTAPLKALVASGYNGPLAASDVGRTFLAQASQAGLISQDMQDKWANARASEVFSQELLGAVIKEYGSRGGVAIARVAGLGKPGMENSTQARLAMVNGIETDANNFLNTNAAKIQYMASHPDDPLATKFQQPTPQAPKPAGKLTAPPMAAVQYLRSHPELRADFDAKYGAGAAAVVLGK